MIDYPSDPGAGFGLTDGVGTQVFVLAASSKALPALCRMVAHAGRPCPGNRP